MTSPGPIAAVTTTTPSSTTSLETPETPIDLENFSIDQIAVGEPLVWEETKTLVEGVPIELTSHEGWFYLFATPTTGFNQPGSGGLRAWRSEDGGVWDYLGEVIPPGPAILAVEATERGLIAASSDEDGRGLVLLQSSDGVSWEAETVPLEDDPLVRVSYATIAANEQTIVVSTYRDLAIDQLIAERLEQIQGAESAVHRWGWGVNETGDNPTFSLWGPFGFALAEVSAEDLRLTEAEIEQVHRWNQGEGTGPEVWVKDHTGVWAESQVPDAHWIDSIVVPADGVFVASGGDATGNTAWTSADGLTWEEMTPRSSLPWRIEPWGESLVGPTNMNSASVLISPDGDDWTDIGPGDLFPSPLQWSMNDVAAGPAGIVGRVIGWSAESPVETVPTPAPTLRDEGAILTMDYEMGQLTLVAGAETFNWSMYTSTTPEGMSVDLATGTISFSHPESGEHLGDFTLEDIETAEQTFWSYGWAGNEENAMVFSPDGETWTIQDPAASFGDEDLVYLLEVGESTVVAVTHSLRGLINPANAGGFSVWAAPIP